ncbi:MAG TPA: right-handed parallel beta-helix repeat-containing protein, partial [Polyangia bacterium]|nr:right-handed parallel beta-helix repeat-containing protein [Polyangia bacterium]
DTKPSAIIGGDTTAAAVSITGATTTVLLDELEVIGGATQDGINCNSGALGPTMVLRRSSVHGSGALGVDVTKCTVTLDRDQIGPSNTSGGISLSGAPYTITNCFIVANGSGGSGVLIGSGATATAPGFMHNTVVSNAAGGILCSGATTIANSIIEGNTPMDTSGACTLTGSTSLVPDFVSATDYHLNGRTTANLACCIDQLTTSPVDHDYDGRARPQPTNGKWDVGAHEVP